MSDFFTRLAKRLIEPGSDLLRPATPSRFEAPHELLPIVTEGAPRTPGVRAPMAGRSAAGTPPAAWLPVPATPPAEDSTERAPARTRHRRPGPPTSARVSNPTEARPRIAGRMATRATATGWGAECPRTRGSSGSTGCEGRPADATGGRGAAGSAAACGAMNKRVRQRLPDRAWPAPRSRRSRPTRVAVLAQRSHRRSDGGHGRPHRRAYQTGRGSPTIGSGKRTR